MISKKRSLKNLIKYRIQIKTNRKMNKFSIISFTLYQMIRLGVHLGHNKNLYNFKLAAFLIGFRNYIHILNLEYTNINLKKILYLLCQLSFQRANILFYNKDIFTSELIKFSALTCKQAYIYQYYIGGILTNFKKCYWIIRFLSVVKMNIYYSIQSGQTKQKYSKFYGAMYLKNIPDCIIIFNQILNPWIKKEALKLKIPIISIVDSNCSIEGIDYPIFGNDDSLEVIFFYASLFKKIIKEGRWFELLNFKINT